MSINNAKRYEELTIRDYFMFGKICSEPANRKLILDSLLQMNLQEKTGAVEKHIQEYKDKKYARLDLLVEDEESKIYNAEMQNKSSDSKRQIELPKRSRYYQSILDTTSLNSNASYLELPETYIIFICTFDPFGCNIPIYTFELKCLEDSSVEYSDCTHKIYFNTTAELSNLPQNMRNMLEYINSGVANDEATKTIDSAIKEARLKEEWKGEYMLTMTFRNEVYAEGREDGLEQGREQGIEQGSFATTLDNIKSAMNNLGLTFDEVCEALNIQDKEKYREFIK